MSTQPPQPQPHRTGLFLIRQGKGGSRPTPLWKRLAVERNFDNRVADLLAEGKSFKTIARALDVGVAKVRYAYRRICVGLGEN